MAHDFSNFVRRCVTSEAGWIVSAPEGLQPVKHHVEKLHAAATRACEGKNILGFMVAIMFFGLMRQTSAWECDSSVPSILSAIESNLRLPKPLIFICFMPILLFLALLISMTKQKPPFGTFLLVTMICYIVANGFTILLVISSKLFLYAVAILHVFIKRRSVRTSNTFSCNFK
ncbi:hypothetical protein U9M48_013467 [Paspalum notatum var. saurae]|uniref:Uncharacterized protein n=1 Tax=Paspalum notatum var. saurae TaxID=547442 RepID=A0AAQ3T1T8_PASNO